MSKKMETKVKSDVLKKNEMNNTKVEHQREIGIDVLKGLGIIFVMLGHIVGTNYYGDIYTYIYTHSICHSSSLCLDT